MADSFEARMTAREAHVDLFNRYARALDERNWPVLASLFTEDGVFGFSRSLGFGAGEADATSIEGRDKLVAMIAGSIECLSATHHLLSSCVVDVDAGGDTAEASSYFRAYHAGKDNRAQLFEESLGRFDIKTVRIGPDWKIRWMHETIMIMLGTPDVFA